MKRKGVKGERRRLGGDGSINSRLPGCGRRHGPSSLGVF